MDAGAKEAEQVPSACCYESGQGSISRARRGLGPGHLVVPAQQVGIPSCTLLASVSHCLLRAQAGLPRLTLPRCVCCLSLSRNWV